MKFTIVALLLAVATAIAVPGDDDGKHPPIKPPSPPKFPARRHSANTPSDLIFPFEQDPVEPLPLNQRSRHFTEDQQFSSHNKLGYENGFKKRFNEDQQFSSHSKLGYKGGMEKRFNEDQQFSSHNKVGYENADEPNSHFKEDQQFSSHNKVGYEGGRKRGLRGSGGRTDVPPQ
ncbi:hypothetical protein B0T14DRAFT_570677 [Immersiella caudata]|uniref:Uncharacterized protein n=1 Tax=Immersiella caudata TaxID=314043 RepID=A0AA39T192_9PEZI|nr:hypothetical protein B0T14DRAFT_570677 [Immersiella caudata]